MKIFYSRSRNNSAVKQKYGVIKTNILKYITPTMIVVVALCAALILLNYEQVYENYSTNIPLNSLIVLIFIFAMVEAFNNNINVLNVAHFFKKVEAFIQKPLVSDEDVKQLKAMLETKAYLINTQNTFKLVDNLQKYGKPFISDNDAKLIKTKLGFRIRLQRSSVSFMAGILVMLGLIGTFWGLLITIGAVGEAMDTIATQANSLGSEDSEGGGIGGIITSISAPLQGMGLAFSSSLFGLSGSLIVGFFNYACSQAQDGAIEDFSRWIDENIPTEHGEEGEVDQTQDNFQNKEERLALLLQMLDRQKEGEEGDGSGASEDKDLTSQILYTLRESIDANLVLFENFEKLLSSQEAVYDVLEMTRQDLSAIRNTQSSLNETLVGTANVIQDSHGIQKLMHENSDKSLNVAKQIYAQTAENQEVLRGGLLDVRKDLSSFEKNMREANTQKLRLVQEVSSISEKISQGDYEMIRKSCSEIAQSIGAMDASLKQNVEVMAELSKEGNMQKMSRIAKDMQIFWLQMRRNASDVKHARMKK